LRIKKTELRNGGQGENEEKKKKRMDGREFPGTDQCSGGGKRASQVR
jgi:hypothetical protein